MRKTAICFAGGVMRHFGSGFPFAYSPICANAHAPGPFLRAFFALLPESESHLRVFSALESCGATLGLAG